MPFITKILRELVKASRIILLISSINERNGSVKDVFESSREVYERKSTERGDDSLLFRSLMIDYEKAVKRERETNYRSLEVMASHRMFPVQSNCRFGRYEIAIRSL